MRKQYFMLQFKMKSWWKPQCSAIKCRAQKPTSVTWAFPVAQFVHQTTEEACLRYSLTKQIPSTSFSQDDSWQYWCPNCCFQASSTSRLIFLAPFLLNEFHRPGLLPVSARSEKDSKMIICICNYVEIKRKVKHPQHKNSPALQLVAQLGYGAVCPISSLSEL